MAGSRKSLRSDFVAELAAEVAARLDRCLQPGAAITAALSGGLDSVVLLDCLTRLRTARPFTLAALHVNHGLSPNAHSWAAFCRDLCCSRDVPLRIVEVCVERARGESLEAAARRVRYAVFRQHVSGILALAHHLDDQVETLMLQLLRGAGPRGAGAMPVTRVEVAGHDRNEPFTILRPLLQVPRSRLDAYAREAKLSWVEDESNADTELDRNYLRARVLPVIEARFPGYRKTLARSADLFCEAAGLLDELAALDGANAVRDATLDVDTLRCLSEPRARNLLRWFLRLYGAEAPNAKRVAEAVRQLVNARVDGRVRVAIGSLELRRHGGRVHLVSVAPLSTEIAVWNGEAVLPAPGGPGAVLFQSAEGAGIALTRLTGREVTLRHRTGGERIRPDCRRPRRTLKNLLQEAHVEPWRRSRMPLLFCDGQLIWAPGIGIDCDWQAAPGEPGIVPEWRCHPADAGRAEAG